jgi:hypothetical protein
MEFGSLGSVRLVPARTWPSSALKRERGAAIFGGANACVAANVRVTEDPAPAAAL